MPSGRRSQKVWGVDPKEWAGIRSRSSYSLQAIRYKPKGSVDADAKSTAKPSIG
jgi:hypothetical protein